MLMPEICNIKPKTIETMSNNRSQLCLNHVEHNKQHNK